MFKFAYYSKKDDKKDCIENKNDKLLSTVLKIYTVCSWVNVGINLFIFSRIIVNKNTGSYAKIRDILDHGVFTQPTKHLL